MTTNLIGATTMSICELYYVFSLSSHLDLPLLRFADHDMVMHFRGGGVGHKVTRAATDTFKKDRDKLDSERQRDNQPEIPVEQNEMTEEQADEQGFPEADDCNEEVEEEMEAEEEEDEEGEGEDEDEDGEEGKEGNDDDDEDGEEDEVEQLGYAEL